MYITLIIALDSLAGCFTFMAVTHNKSRRASHTLRNRNIQLQIGNVESRVNNSIDKIADTDADGNKA